ncbi:MAG: DJ-1/PfpI family protein [Clostridiaceae bacterium]|nr:DJ-1/PfpI family protein [Clostridiaceae bacterium]
MKVFVHLAEGFEEIEAITVVDVLRRVNIEVETVSVTGKMEVTGGHGITVTADRLFEDTDYSLGNMIVLPGGMPGTKNLYKHTDLSTKLKEYSESGKWIAAICAAPSIIGKLGLLRDRDATCYPGFEQELEGAKVCSLPVVNSGKIITSRGPGTAIKFALKLVEVLKGEKTSEELKDSMIAKEG